MKRAGILTGGGDCPGLNAVLRAVTYKLNHADVEVIGFIEGWRGVLEGLTQPLTIANTSDILIQGGTILGSSRTNPFQNEEENVPKIREAFKKFELDVLIVVGGDDTLGVAAQLYEKHQINTIGVPKTIDNDLSCTDYTFGFDTAVNLAMEAMDNLITTAESHRRCFVVEIMGRHAGWIAFHAGLAANADVVLIPEKPIDLKQVCGILKRNRDAGKKYNIVAVAEGCTFQAGTFETKDDEIDEFGNVKLGGISKALAKMIEEQTGYETRHVVLGHTQRCGRPSAYDRILATRYGLKAAELALAGDFGKMAALRGNEIISVDLAEAASETKTVPDEFFAIAEEFFG